MKAKSIIIAAAFVIVIGGIVIAIALFSRPIKIPVNPLRPSQNLSSQPEFTETGEFHLSDFSWGIENFPSDKNIGQTLNAADAVKKAKSLWIEEFSMLGGKPYNPINGLMIEVQFDSDNKCWHINGTLPSDTLGAVPQALINTSGDVLAVWIE